jgi:predicted NUDIX family phosphoesterase
MNQVIVDKMKREVMVVKNDHLFADISREDRFYSNDEINIDEIVNKHYEFMVRWEAEDNREYKQPIGYAAVVDSENKVFVYKRGGKDSKAGEARLHSKYAFGVGWHIEREDEDSENILRDSMVREVEEELEIIPSDIISIEPLGYINFDSDDVSEVHIWAGYIVRVKHNNISLLDGELASWEYMTIDQIEDLISSWECDLESWSKILFPSLKKALSK